MINNDGNTGKPPTRAASLLFSSRMRESLLRLLAINDGDDTGNALTRPALLPAPGDPRLWDIHGSGTSSVALVALLQLLPEIQPLRKIQPLRIPALNQLQLPCPIPPVQLLLA